MFSRKNEKKENSSTELEEYENIEIQDFSSETLKTAELYDVEKKDPSFKKEPNHSKDEWNPVNEQIAAANNTHNDLFVEDVIVPKETSLLNSEETVSTEINEKDVTSSNSLEEEVEEVENHSTDILEKVDGISSLLENQFNVVDKKLNQLSYEFEQKLKHDQHNEKIIDKLHNELQGYKDNLIQERLMPVIMDLILTIDRSVKLKKSLDSGEAYAKHLKAIDGTIVDLEDILYTQGVESYECEENQFHKMEQKIVRTIKTNDLSLDKQIAERLGKGYTWDERVIRKEQVSVYVYEEVKEEA